MADHVDHVLSDRATRRLRERGIETAWIEAALSEPDRVLPDPVDPSAKHALKRIVARDDRVLRGVYNDTVEPICVISVYFDRGMKGKL